MRNLFGKYNRNRKFIWLIVGIIVVPICLIHIADYEIKQEKESLTNSTNVNIIKEQFYNTNKPVISPIEPSEEISKDVTNVIKEFIEFCNNGEVQKAYDMLYTDCKEVLYPTMEDFKNNYYNINFDKRKTYSLQSWINDTNKYIYLVEIKEDILTTGVVSNVKKQDYYTVIEEDENYYLNISGFIEKNSINKETQKDKIKILIESEEVFIDYLNLNITVNNNSANKILLDGGNTADSVAVIDDEGIEYLSYLFEKNNSDLIIRPNSSEFFKIKFMKNYKTNRPIKMISFEDIILDYEDNNSDSTYIIINL